MLVLSDKNEINRERQIFRIITNYCICKYQLVIN